MIAAVVFLCGCALGATLVDLYLNGQKRQKQREIEMENYRERYKEWL